MLRKIFLVSLCMFVLGHGFISEAHSGRTDSYGGHYVRTAGHGYSVGSYHYHSGPYAGYTVSYKGEVPEDFVKNEDIKSDNYESSTIQSEEVQHAVQKTEQKEEQPVVQIEEQKVDTKGAPQTNFNVDPNADYSGLSPASNSAVELDKLDNQSSVNNLNTETNYSNKANNSVIGVTVVVIIGSVIYFMSKKK